MQRADSLAVSLQRAVGNQATCQILQRIHFHSLRGVLPAYETEETGGKKALFVKNVKDDLQKLAARHEQVVAASTKNEITVPSATGSGVPVPIDNVKRTLAGRREVYRRQFPAVLGGIPDDWDFKPTAVQLSAIETSIGNVERHGVTPGAQTPDETLVTVNAGRLKRADGSDVDTTGSSTFFSGAGWEIFVISWTGELHMSSHLIGRRHHSSLLAGKDTAAAGEMKVVAGTIERLSNKSGHYKPGTEDIGQCLHVLRKRGVTLNFDVDIQDSTNKTTSMPASDVYDEQSYRAGKAQFAKSKAETAFESSHHFYSEQAISKEVNEAIAKQMGWQSLEVSDPTGFGDPTYELQTMTGVPVDPKDAYRAYKAYIGANKADPLTPRVAVGGQIVSRPKMV